MKAATIHEIKQELIHISPARLLELCVRLAKFKKENKELLSYLLFDEQDETAYLIAVKKEMELQFADINKSNLYFAKKSLRKILKLTNKYIRYNGAKQVEVELLLHYCQLLHDSGIAIQKNAALNNIYHGQLKKIARVLDTLHEDLQYDYLKQLRQLN